MIVAEQLIFDYARTRALDGASMTAPQGSVTALVGPNGAGKTTLMRVLAGLEPVQAGNVTIAGIDAAEDPRAIQRMVGFMADFIGLYDDLTAEQHLLYFGRAAGLNSTAARTRGQDIAGQLGISALLGRKAGEMSRGQRQRLAIAQSLMKAPELIILDEPASGLDPEARAGLSQLLLRLKGEGKTILVSSHILSELDDYSDRVVVMKAGRVAREEMLVQETTRDGVAAELVVLTLSEPVADLAARLAAALPAIEVAAVRADGADLRLAGGAAARQSALKSLLAADLPVAEFAPRQRRLADAYFETGDEGTR
ncbi:MAG: ABC transporter ATP-binding protein [Pseudomonadota bacterium]